MVSPTVGCRDGVQSFGFVSWQISEAAKTITQRILSHFLAETSAPQEHTWKFRNINFDNFSSIYYFVHSEMYCRFENI
jgi:hypothetical protein